MCGVLAEDAKGEDPARPLLVWQDHPEDNAKDHDGERDQVADHPLFKEGRVVAQAFGEIHVETTVTACDKTTTHTLASKRLYTGFETCVPGCTLHLEGAGIKRLCSHYY